MCNVDYILSNLTTTLTPENYIGEGQSRIAYRIGDYVVKTFKHGMDSRDGITELYQLAYQQSVVEYELHSRMPEWVKEYFNNIYYVDESLQISKYREPYSSLYGEGHMYYDPIDESTLKLYPLDVEFCFAPNGREIVQWLWDNDIDTSDMFDYDNFAIREDGHMLFIDYGRKFD